MAISPALFLLGVPTEHTGFLAAGNTPILFTSSDTPTVNTGDTAVVTVATSGGTGDIDFAIVGGADSGMFSLDAETGALAFLAASVDGTYEVIVRAFSDWGSADQAITVTVAAGGYHADAVYFEESVATYLSRNANLTGAADSPLFLYSAWINYESTGNRIYLDSNVPGNGGFGSYINPDGTLTFFVSDATNTYYLEYDSTDTLPTGTWINLRIALDMNHADGAKIVQAYSGDTPISGNVTDGNPAFSIGFVDSNNDYTENDVPPFLGGYPASRADTWIGQGQFADQSITANRRKFIDGSGKPVFLGATGQLPTGASPIVFFSGDMATYPVNKGTGGAFTLTGSLTNASTSPSD